MAHGPVFDEEILADVVICGAGVAGLCAALALKPLRVALLTKSRLSFGANSLWAQGGIAAAIGEGDSPELHSDDTEIAGAGLSDSAAVDVLTHSAPAAIAMLTRLGTRFDRDATGRIDLAREAAHRMPRVLHARQDATGSEIMRVLCETVTQAQNIDVVEHAYLCDVATDDNRVACGVVVVCGGRRLLFRSPAVILATGGLGQLYLYSTNPVEACGEGLAVAARAGAVLSDMEFVQFHPTALKTPTDPLPLITEAVRGEGAWLVDSEGTRFMPSVHPDAELAPRDVVARAVFERMAAGKTVFLDATEALGARFPERFPTVFQQCLQNGFDPRREPIPIVPAAHYHMGGVTVDLHGRASLEGLWACGEVASSGIHGANRLASNSLLEAIVFGNRAAEDILNHEVRQTTRPTQFGAMGLHATADVHEHAVSRDALRRLMWDRVGLIRDAEGLAAAIEQIQERLWGPPTTLREANRALVCSMIAHAALKRPESRGAHYRRDFPHPRDELRRHSLVVADQDDGKWRVHAALPAAAGPASGLHRELEA